MELFDLAEGGILVSCNPRSVHFAIERAKKTGHGWVNKASENQMRCSLFIIVGPTIGSHQFGNQPAELPSLALISFSTSEMSRVDILGL